MFEKKFYERLRTWNSFRETLETSIDPIQDIIDFYKTAPLVNIQVDPWDPSTWLDPWELVYENQYCDFSKLLGICYSLQLTERFISENFEIHIVTNKKESKVYYLLFFQNKVIGYDCSKAVDRKDLPKELEIQKIYTMPPLN